MVGVLAGHIQSGGGLYEAQKGYLVRAMSTEQDNNTNLIAIGMTLGLSVGAASGAVVRAATGDIGA